MKALSGIAGLLSVGALSALSFLAAPASAQEEYLIRAGTTVSEKDTDTQALRLWGDLVERRSNGRIKVEVFPDSQLGSSQAQVDGVKLGVQQAVMVNLQYFSSMVPWAAASDLPFLFASSEDAWLVYDGWWGQSIGEALEENGVKVLGWGQAGFRNMLTNGHALLEPADAKGMKIRVLPSKVHQQLFENLGANPTPMDFSEVYTAIEAGVLDGLDIPLIYVLPMKWNEVIDYVSITNHMYTALPLAFNKQFYDSLPADLQEIVSSSAKMATDWHRVSGTIAAKKAEAEIAATDMHIERSSPEQLEAFKAAERSLYEQAVQDYGKERIERLTGMTF